MYHLMLPSLLSHPFLAVSYVLAFGIYIHGSWYCPKWHATLCHAVQTLIIKLCELFNCGGKAMNVVASYVRVRT